MAIHTVKSWQPFFRAFLSGEKKHDMRDMVDRDYQIGDTLVLQEYLPFEGKYTGSELEMKITYITSEDTPCAFSSAALARGYCILSLEHIDD